MPKRITALTCAILLAIILVNSPVYAAAKLAISETEFDFGYVPQKAKVTHVYWLKSVGDDMLRILKVVPGCGCTKAPIEKDTLAAGDSTSLEVTFNTKGYNGQVTKSPQIQTNAETATTRIHFTANVVTDKDRTYPITISPSILDMGKSRDGADMNFEISNVSDSDLHIRLIDKSCNCFGLKLPEIIGAGETVRGLISMKNAESKKPFEKSFTIEVDDEARTRFTIPIVRKTDGDTQARLTKDSH